MGASIGLSPVNTHRHSPSATWLSELLKTVVSRVVRIAVLWSRANQLHPRMLNEAETPARPLGLRLQRLPVDGPDSYDGAFAAVSRRADALLALGDPIFWH